MYQERQRRLSTLLGEFPYFCTPEHSLSSSVDTGKTSRMMVVPGLKEPENITGCHMDTTVKDSEKCVTGGPRGFEFEEGERCQGTLL